MGNSLAMDMDTSERPQNADIEEDYECPICQEVMKMPIRTRNCQHVFCKGCFQAAVRNQGPQCPMCRGRVSEKEPRATDIQQMMKEKKGKCRACGKERFLNKMRLHYRSCKKYIEEYGLISDPASFTSDQTPSQTVSQGVLPNFRQPAVFTSSGRVYNCPYCPRLGLSDMELVEHCVGQHAHERTPVVCPICACMPWGNASYYSRNFVAHLRRRHCISYSTYIDENEDEDFQLCQAMQFSAMEF